MSGSFYPSLLYLLQAIFVPDSEMEERRAKAVLFDAFSILAFFPVGDCTRVSQKWHTDMTVLQSH
jgi:hypothetical protein